LGCEDHIVRTTVYLPDYLHAKGKQLKINFSKEFETYLRTRFYDDDLLSLEVQLDEAREQVKKLSAELSIWKNRVAELEKAIKEHDTKVASEKNIYSKFLNHVLARLSRSEETGAGIEYDLLARYWKKEFFQGNNINIRIAKEILYCVKNNNFSFDMFRRLRRGELVFEN